MKLVDLLVGHDAARHGRWVVIARARRGGGLLERRAFPRRVQADAAYAELPERVDGEDADVGLIDARSTLVVRTDAPAGDELFANPGYW